MYHPSLFSASPAKVIFPTVFEVVHTGSTRVESDVAMVGLIQVVAREHLSWGPHVHGS